MKIEISKLFDHPKNRFIYGYDDNSELAEKIKSTGWIKPILITKDNMILSGHRRVDVCKSLGITEIEYELIEEEDSTKLLELLVGENYYRVKTTTQLMKEADVYFEIEKQKSYERMMAGTNPESNGSQGRTTEIVSKKVGMGENSFKKGKKVMRFIDKNPEYAWFFENTMDQSIEKSVQMTEKPIEFIEQAIEKIGNDKQKILTVIRELEQEEKKSNTNLPQGKYGVIIIDLSNRPITDLLKTDISSICEKDSVLLMWVRPDQLETGLHLSKNWGFNYSTCLIWNKDNHQKVTLNGEILLVTIKGSPPKIFKQYKGSDEKPSVIKDIVSKGFPDMSKVELFIGEGWKYV